MSIPIMKDNQPIKVIIIRIKFFIKIEIVSKPPQEIIPETNKITQAILSFLFTTKSERNIIVIPLDIKSIPINMFERKNKLAMSALYLEKNPQNLSIAVKLYFILRLINESE